jgi:hypothetical protein
VTVAGEAVTVAGEAATGLTLFPRHPERPNKRLTANLLIPLERENIDGA